ncbi:hypothetical protein pb186bvf_020293 [Paramecium bursaria]
MPPKKEERKPLEPIFQTIEPFYQYIEYTPEQIDQINNFLNYFRPELTNLLKTNIYDNMAVLCQQIGVHLHPSFQKPNKFDEVADFDENAKFRNQEDGDVEQKDPTMIQIVSIKLDVCTLKLFDYCLQQSGITILKFCNNQFPQHIQSLLGQVIANPENKLKRVFFDWNIITDELIKTVPLNPNLEFLTLRSCNLTDQAVEALCTTIKQLKCLDLYDNHLSKNSFNAIGKMLANNASMEFLGLAKNQIQSFDELQGITQNLGKFLLSPEELEDYRNKEKERDAIIERNKKVKKKGTEEIVPVLEPLQQIENNFYIVRNSRLWLINLAMNYIDDNSRDQIEKFLTQTGDNFQLVLTTNRFEDQKNIQKWKKKYGKKLVL